MADGGGQRRGTHTGHTSSSRSRSTVELAKEKAAAEGKKWREIERIFEGENEEKTFKLGYPARIPFGFYKLDSMD